MTISINNITMLSSVEKTILERQSSFSSSEETITDKTLKDSVKFDVFLDSNNNCLIQDNIKDMYVSNLQSKVFVKVLSFK